MIDAALRPVLEDGAFCTNLVKRLRSKEELDSPNLVKVVGDLGDAQVRTRQAADQ